MTLLCHRHIADQAGCLVLLIEFYIRQVAHQASSATSCTACDRGPGLDAAVAAGRNVAGLQLLLPSTLELEGASSWLHVPWTWLSVQGG